MLSEAIRFSFRLSRYKPIAWTVENSVEDKKRAQARPGI